MRNLLRVTIALVVAASPASAGSVRTLHKSGEPRLLLHEDLVTREPKYRALEGLRRFNETTLFGKSGPHWDDVRQGEALDCFFLAALSSLAHGDPERLKAQFARHADGTLALDKQGRVQAIFYRKTGADKYRADRVPITAKLPLDNNGEPLFAKAETGKLWVAALEKAYVRWNDKTNGNAANWTTFGKHGWDRLDGGDPAMAMESLRGGPTATVLFKPRLNEVSNLFAIIARALADRRLVVATSSTSAREAKQRQDSAQHEGVLSPNMAVIDFPFRPFHAFSVLGAYARGEKKYLLLRDPYGDRERADGSKDPVNLFEISMEKFVTLFIGLSFEEATAPLSPAGRRESPPARADGAPHPDR